MTSSQDYDSWAAVNGSAFSRFDYARAILTQRRGPADLVVSLARLIWPVFQEIDGRVFLCEQLSRLEALRNQGYENEKLEYWVNLFSVDGFLGDMDGASPDHQTLFAAVLAEAWKGKLRQDFPMRRFEVKVIDDEDDTAVVFFQT